MPENYRVLIPQWTDTADQTELKANSKLTEAREKRLGMSLDHAESGTPTARPKPSQRNAEKQEGQKQNMSESVVQEQVMKQLGELPNLIRVQVRALWKGHYRANIYVGSDHLTSRIAHSFFIITDDAGKISESRPPIARNRPYASSQQLAGSDA